MRENINSRFKCILNSCINEQQHQQNVNADLCSFTRSSRCNSTLCPSGSGCFYFLPFSSSQHRCDMTLTLLPLSVPKQEKKKQAYFGKQMITNPVKWHSLRWCKSLYLLKDICSDGKCIHLQLRLYFKHKKNRTE